MLAIGLPLLLCDRIDHFIAHPQAGGFFDLLNACVQDGSSEAMLQVRRLFVAVPEDAFTTPESLGHSRVGAKRDLTNSSLRP